jgi:rare lipoprotein A (peptidoglycan hydrolase)
MLDLSYGAAEKLAMIKPGVAKVKMEVISLGKDSTQK